MSDQFEEILKRAKEELSKAEQQKLAEVLAQTAAQNGGQQRSITELKGLGKEIWKDVDADEYVAKERDSWDG